MEFTRWTGPAVLALCALASAACGREVAGGARDEGSLEGLTVIDAVQLGAAQSCHGAADAAGGSITLSPLEGEQGLVLLIDDGYPLCIDTIENAAAEIERIEASYLDDAEHESAQTTGEDGTLIPMILQTDDERETDPNPQPALKVGTPATIIASATSLGSTPPPAPGTQPPAPDRPTTDED